MKNIILFSIDNLRYDCVGYQPDKTALVKHHSLQFLDSTCIDRIADKSLCLSNCYSTNTYTTSAHTSLLTGLYPPGHGVRAFYDTKISRDVFTLAEVLKVYGYETVMLSDIPVLFEPLELNRGFDQVFGNNEDERLFELLKKLRAENKKVFLLIHVFDVHEPYLFSESPMTDDYNADYFSEMKRMYEHYGIPIDNTLNPHTLYVHLVNIKKDKKTMSNWLNLYVKGVTKFYNGRFKYFIDNFEELNYFDDSMMFFFSDHGEGRITDESPDSFSHGGLLFEEILRIPMILYIPGGTHKRDDRLASIVDVFPTVLEAVSGQPSSEVLPYDIDGVNLLSHEMEIGSYRDRKFVYSEKWFCKSSPITLDSSGKRWEVTSRLYIDVEPFLMQRAFINNDEKVLIWGRPEEVIFDKEALLKLDPSHMIDRLFKDLLVRKAKNNGIKSWTERIEEVGQEKVIDEFIRSQETNKVISCEYYKKNKLVKRQKRFNFIQLSKMINDNSPDDGVLNVIKNVLQKVSLIEKNARTGEEVFLPGQPLINNENTRYIVPVNNPPVMESNNFYELDIRLKNTSNVPWTSDGNVLGGPMRLSYHWYYYKREDLKINGLRTEIPSEVRPGEEIDLKARVQTPPEPGEYILEFDMVVEDVNWLKNLGFPTTRLKINVK